MVKKPLSFTPVHALLAARHRTEWALYWKASKRHSNTIFENYPGYIGVLAERIKCSGANRVFIIQRDRAFFLAGLLASLEAGVPVVLPQSDAPGLLKDLFEPQDGLLTDQENLRQIAPSFISMLTDTRKEPHSLKFNALDRTTPLLTFYTSGSAGTPKAIQKTLKQLEEEIAVLENMWGAPESAGPFLSTVSHHHIYGLLFSLLWPICGGYPLECRTFSYWEELIKNAVTDDPYIISSPAHLGRFPLFMKEEDRIKASRIFSSGGPLSFENAQATQEFLGRYPIEVYGSTETGGIAYRQQFTEKQLWTKFTGIDLSLDEEKRLWIRSPYLPDETFYQTDDRISLENENQFHLLGRADRTIKVEGKRVNLLEIERKLTNFADIQDASVIPLESRIRDELGAIIVLSPGGQNKLDSFGKIQLIRDLRKDLRMYVDAVALPRKWRFVSEIPLNKQGKRSYKFLRSYFGGGE